MKHTPYNTYSVDIIPNSYADIKNKIYKIVSKETIDKFNKKFDLKYLGFHDFIFIGYDIFNIYYFDATNGLSNLFDLDININVKL